MTVTWERFAGRTDKFAIRLSLMADPDDGEGARPEDAASWGSLQMWTGNHNLCAHVDQGETLTSVHWYLLPFAEWVADNWNALFHEERLPTPASADTGVLSLDPHRMPPAFGGETDVVAREQILFDWRTRHALRAAREGGLFPNVVLRRLRDYVEISWDSAPEVGAPVGFEFSAGRGANLLDPRDVVEPLYEVLAALADTLADRDTSGRVADLRARLEGLATRYQGEDRLNWMVGPGGWDRVRQELTSGGRTEAVEAALATVDTALVVAHASPAALLFASVAPDVTGDDVRTLASVLVDQYAVATEARLDRLVENVPLDERRPAWEQGYDLAESIHDELEIDMSAGWVDVEAFLSELDVRIVERSLTDVAVAACSIVGPHHVPTIVLNRNHRVAAHSTVRRFVLAHELCHLLYDRAEGAPLAIASGPWAPRVVERRAGAFAAMFLLPPALVEQTLGRLTAPPTTTEGITEFAKQSRISRSAALHHLANMALLSEIERDELLRRVQD